MKYMLKRHNTLLFIAELVLLATASGILQAQEEIRIPPPSLKTVAVPVSPQINQFVKNKSLAIMLGKALFWDMQVGSDGVQACASCHFNAGADNRVKNQLNPGPNGQFDLGGLNHKLRIADFPFHRKLNMEDRNSPVTFDTDDICSSQGVFGFNFNDVVYGDWQDDGLISIDPLFNINGINVRRVEPRNSPTTINAVFNYRNFWDGRASNYFNGVDPFGKANPNAVVFKAVGTGVQPVTIDADFLSLASQSVGPPLSPIEMSFAGRGFMDLGKKMLKLKALARQKIHPEDSMLGAYADLSVTGKGMRLTYADLIKLAFRSEYWNSTKIVKSIDGTPTVMNRPNRPLANDEYTLMEANFALFWGFAIHLYESTLVSDDSPYDRFQEGLADALTDAQQRGLNVFMNKGRCINCHAGPVFSNATIPAMINDPDAPGQFLRIERMAMADAGTAVYDVGFYNIGVRPTAEDPGVGGTDPWDKPLSFARKAQLGDPVMFDINPPVDTGERVAVDGAFKTPTLRNVELTAPYFHNGGQATLEQVVQFYDRGGDFAQANIENLALDIVDLGLTDQEKTDLVEFLKALTDERVRYEMAPFDHPELFIPDGHPGDEDLVFDDGTGKATDTMLQIPAVGRQGRTEPIRLFFLLMGLI